MLKNNKKHSKSTPPKEKPGWLRKGIASLAAFATLATGGLVAVSSADAIDNSGNGVITGGGGNTGIGPNDFVLWLKDNLAQTAAGKPPTGWGTRDNANTSDLLSDLAKAGVEVSDYGTNKPLIQKACNQAVNRALDATHQRARVIGFATSLRGGAMWGDNATHWKSLFEQRWSQAQAQPNGGVRFFLNGWTDGDVTKFARGEFDKGMAEMAAGGTVMNTAICVAVNESQPPMGFTPTISTEAPHIIQEGQPITDRVTVGVKSGDHWIDGTSVTAKGYYFTGSKDAIIRNLPYNGDPTDAGINNYLNQIRSAGGEYPWVTGMGARYGLNRAESGPWVRDGDKNDSRAGRKRERRPAGRVRPGRRGGPPECHFAPLPIAYCLSPVELGLVCGQDGFVVFFRSVGQEDRRLSHAESRLVQGQQYPGSFASEVFPADKQDRRVRSCGLDHSFTLVEVGYAGVPQQLPQGRNTRLRGSRLRVFDGPQLAEE